MFNILFFYIKNVKNNKKIIIFPYIFFLSFNAKRWHLDKFCYYWEISTYSFNPSKCDMEIRVKIENKLPVTIFPLIIVINTL